MGCEVYFFSSSSYQDVKREENCDQLFSVYEDKKQIKNVIDYRKEHPEYTGKIMIDSGAYSLYQKYKKEGKSLPDSELKKYVDDYIDFLNEYGEEFFVFVGVDSVPNPLDVDQTFAQKTWDNYLYMYNKLRPEIRNKLMPVFHFGEDFKWLDNMLEFIHPDGHHVEYVGLAISLEDNKKVRIEWAQKCMSMIKKSSNPDVKTHAFGVGVKNVLEHINVTSTDATSWVMRASYGMIAIDDRAYFVSSVRKDMMDGSHYSEYNPAYKEAVEKEIERRGFTVEQVASDAKYRARFNIKDTLNWMKEIKGQKAEHMMTKVSLF